MTNYIDGVIKILDVVYEERFDIKTPHEEFRNSFMSQEGLMVYNQSLNKYHCCNHLLGYILSGEWQIIKGPFYPALGQRFYFMSEDDKVDWCDFNPKNPDHVCRIYIGNCFKSSEIAIANKEKIYKKVKTLLKMCNITIEK